MKNLQELSSLAVLGGQPTVTQKLASWPIFDDREREAVGQVLESGAWGGYSPVVKAFEQCFAQAHGCEFGISTANGTLSLEAALIACGVGHGDEVIVPPITFAATATAVLRIGAVPVFSDIERNSFNLDPCRLEEAISERTKAMIPVHFAGHPADLDQIMNIAAKRNLVVLEDCAHAHGASWRGRNVGSIGSLGSFSFQQSKNMTAGEGGILVTNDPLLAEKTWSIANQGRDRSGAWYEHNSLGTNLRMTGFQAAILNVQLDRVPEQIELRQRNAVKLSSALQRSGAFLPPVVAKEATRHAFHLFVVRMREGAFEGISKDALVRALVAEGVTGVSAYPQPIYRNRLFESQQWRTLPCPEAEAMCKECFWVSNDVLLSDDVAIAQVASAFEKVAAHRRDLLHN